MTAFLLFQCERKSSLVLFLSLSRTSYIVACSTIIVYIVLSWRALLSERYSSIVHRGVLYYHSIPYYFTILISLYSEAGPLHRLARPPLVPSATAILARYSYTSTIEAHVDSQSPIDPCSSCRCLSPLMQHSWRRPRTCSSRCATQLQQACSR